MADEPDKIHGNTIYRPAFVREMYEYRLLGLTGDQIAEQFGVTIQTLIRWRHEYPDLQEAWREGGARADAIVAGSLFRRANGIEYEEEVMTKDGPQRVKKYMPPCTAAASKWLHNRQRNLWRDTKFIGGEEGAPITLDLFYKTLAGQISDTTGTSDQPEE